MMITSARYDVSKNLWQNCLDYEENKKRGGKLTFVVGEEERGIKRVELVRRIVGWYFIFTILLGILEECEWIFRLFIMLIK